MRVKIQAHKQIGFDVRLGNGVHVAAPPGGVYEGDLPGDFIGYVEGVLAQQALAPPSGVLASGGSVHCVERDAAPDAKSKAGLAMAAVAGVEKKAKKKVE